ncbi:hypothetical protein C8Q77DRAFT_1136690 [Trametes polyzona]|nr:hypothetical protein C8Q77DRAFT_1136690 [Trametes polyzona]
MCDDRRSHELHQSLAFLHKHRIAHRDIYEGNKLADWYSYTTMWTRASGNKPCANTTGRIPSRALGDQVYHPDNVQQGEPLYNPFAYDVGSLGFLFVCYFTDAIPTVPMRAPLFGKMATHIVKDLSLSSRPSNSSAASRRTSLQGPCSRAWVWNWTKSP